MNKPYIDGECLVAYRGSIAHNMHNPDPSSIDDIDIVSICIPLLNHYFGLTEWGSRGTKEIKDGRYDIVKYSLDKAVRMLMQGNPNIFALLWVNDEHILYQNKSGQALISNRYLFVGKHVYHSFAGYASAQIAKMTSRDPGELREYIRVTTELKLRGIHPQKETLSSKPEDHPAYMESWTNDALLKHYSSYIKKGENIGYMGDKRKSLVVKYNYDAKNAAHAIRLLKMCKEFLETGVLNVFRTHDREELLDIKKGKWKLEDIKKYAEQLFAETKEIYSKSSLPENVDKKKIEQLLIDVLQDHFYGI